MRNKITQALIVNTFLIVVAVFSFQANAQRVPVSVFNYAGLNGNGTGCDTENRNLIGIIGALPGYTVDGSIVNFSNSATLATQLHASTFFFMTDMETQSPSNTTFLPVASRNVIKDWVNGGGVMVMTATAGTYDTDFLNLIFSWNLGTTSGSSWNKNTANTAGTPFAAVPASSLPALNATDAISKGTVSGFTSMWGTDANTTVAVIKYGSGSVIYMGYDFYDSGPSCSQYSSTWVQQVIPAALRYATELSEGSITNTSYTSADYGYTSTQTGTTSYIVLPAGSTAPTAQQIEAGVNYSGGTVVKSGNTATTANVAQVFNLIGLTYNTGYDVYAVTKYSGTTYTQVAKASFRTLDNDMPVGSSIANQPLLCSGTPSSPIALTITDAYPGNNTFVVTGTSSNTALVPNSNIVITGTGNSRSISITPRPGVVGASTISINISDSLGKASIVSFTVNYGDITAPTIATLSAIRVNADAGVCTYASSQLAVPTASDNCSVVSVIASPTSLVLGANTVTWKVTDGAGLTATSTQTVTVVDSQIPSIDTLSPITVNTDADNCTYASSQLTKPTASDNCSVASVVATPASLVKGINTVTWTVTDGSGLTATSTQTVTVNDITPPSLVAEADQNVVLDSGCKITVPNLVDGSSATDNCSYTITQSPLAGDILSSIHNGSISVKVTATDETGNEDEKIVILTAKDVTAPVLTAEADQDVNFDSGCKITIPDLVDGSSATDNCSYTITQSPLAGDILSIAHNGNISITVTATDEAGNKDEKTVILTAKDITAPVLTAEADQDVNLDSGCKITVPNLVDGSSATDNCTYTITQSPLAGDILSSVHNGNISVIVTATDEAGNKDEKTVILTAKDLTAPVLTVVADQNVNLESGCKITVPNLVDGSSATDNCTYTITQSPLAGDILSSVHNGNVSVKVTATDEAGNKDEKTVILTAKDVTAPVLTAEADQNVNLDSGCSIAVPNVVDGSSVTDNCSYTITQSPLAGNILSSVHNGNISVIVTATDAAGNKDVKTVVLTAKDKISPIFISCPTDITLPACLTSDPATLWINPVAKDNCLTVTPYRTDSVNVADIPAGASAKITYEVQDLAGNKSQCSFMVTRLPQIEVAVNNGNPQLYFGYSKNQSTEIKVTPNGGKAPYKVQISMDRKLIFDRTTSAGDEAWIPSAGCNQSINYATPVTGSPISTFEGVLTCSLTATLMENAVITAIITDANGCVSTVSTNVYAEDARCFAGKSTVAKVKLCHQTGSAKNPCSELCVDESAVAAHLAHGDYLGSCSVDCKPKSVMSTSKKVVEVEELDGFTAVVIPNPSDRWFNLDLNSSNTSEPITMELYDMLGRKVLSYSDLKMNQTTKFGDELQAGTYIALITQGEVVRTVRLIKQ